jgi:hypothetical protein
MVPLISVAAAPLIMRYIVMPILCYLFGFLIGPTRKVNPIEEYRTKHPEAYRADCIVFPLVGAFFVVCMVLLGIAWLLGFR